MVTGLNLFQATLQLEKRAYWHTLGYRYHLPKNTFVHNSVMLAPIHLVIISKESTFRELSNGMHFILSYRYGHMVMANQALHGNTKVRGPGVEAKKGYIGCEL